MTIRYVGFAQNAGARIYYFDQFDAAYTRSRVAVTAEMAVLARNQVPLQDGPSLCLATLRANPEALGQPSHTLSEADVLAFAASRRRAEPASREKTYQPSSRWAANAG